MELDFFRIIATLLNIGLLALIIYIVVKIAIKMINSFNRLERIENKLDEISETLKEK